MIRRLVMAAIAVTAVVIVLHQLAQIDAAIEGLNGCGDDACVTEDHGGLEVSR